MSLYHRLSMLLHVMLKYSYQFSYEKYSHSILSFLGVICKSSGGVPISDGLQKCIFLVNMMIDLLFS